MVASQGNGIQATTKHHVTTLELPKDRVVRCYSFASLRLGRDTKLVR